jgi:hypothetical protein
MKGMDLRRHGLPIAIILLGICTGLVVFTGILPSIRPVLVFVFLLVCPGLVFVRMLRLDDLIMLATLSIALSLAIDAAVATLLLSTAAWSFSRGLVIIFAITLTGLMLGAGYGSSEERSFPG